MAHPLEAAWTLIEQHILECERKLLVQRLIMEKRKQRCDPEGIALAQRGVTVLEAELEFAKRYSAEIAHKAMAEMVDA